MALDFSKLSGDVDTLTGLVEAAVAAIADLKAQLAASDVTAAQATVDALDEKVKADIAALSPPKPETA